MVREKINAGQRWLRLSEHDGEDYEEVAILERHGYYAKLLFVEKQIVTWRHVEAIGPTLLVMLTPGQVQVPADTVFDYASGVVPGAAKELIDWYKYMTAESIEACRFCGNGITAAIPTENGAYIECIACGATGPHVHRRDGETEYGAKWRALELWNKQSPNGEN